MLAPIVPAAPVTRTRMANIWSGADPPVNSEAGVPYGCVANLGWGRKDGRRLVIDLGSEHLDPTQDHWHCCINLSGVPEAAI
jgi:hypothetical protein